MIKPYPYRRFVIISLMRSGSHYLRGLLSSHPGVKVFGEIFNPDPNARSRSLATLNEIQPFDIRTSVSDFLDSEVMTKYDDRFKAVGFKFICHHDSQNPLWQQITRYLVDTQTCILHCVRSNLLNRYLSQTLARNSGASIKLKESSNHSADKTLRQEYQKPVYVNAEHALSDIQAANMGIDIIRKTFKNNPYLELTYEDLTGNTDSAILSVLNFLDLPHAELIPDTHKQRRGNIEDWIANYPELRARLEKTDASRFII